MTPSRSRTATDATTCCRADWPSASRGAERQAEEIRRAREIKTVQGLEHANELKAAIEGLGPVALPVKAAADTGKLFASVTAANVVAAVKKAGGPNLDKRTIQLPKAHIKTVGTHPIAVRLHPDVDAAISLSVVAEQAASITVKAMIGLHPEVAVHAGELCATSDAQRS